MMAGLTVEEGPYGLKRRKYSAAKACESAADVREPLSRTQTPENEEKRVPDSTAHEKAAREDTLSCLPQQTATGPSAEVGSV